MKARTNININPNPKRSRSQKERILELLQNGVVLTPIAALRMVGTTKLATRISELIDEGHTEIKKEKVTVPVWNSESETMGKATVMSYFI